MTREEFEDKLFGLIDTAIQEHVRISEVYGAVAVLMENLKFIYNAHMTEITDWSDE